MLNVTLKLLPRLNEEYVSCTVFSGWAVHLLKHKVGSRWIASNFSEFIGKDEWPPNLLDVTRLDYA